jgi:hypothetical protein
LIGDLVAESNGAGMTSGDETLSPSKTSAYLSLSYNFVPAEVASE